MNARDPINYYRSSTIALGHYAAGEHEAALAAIEFALSGAINSINSIKIGATAAGALLAHSDSV